MSTTRSETWRQPFVTELDKTSSLSFMYGAGNISMLARIPNSGLTVADLTGLVTVHHAPVASLAIDRHHHAIAYLGRHPLRGGPRPLPAATSDAGDRRPLVPGG